MSCPECAGPWLYALTFQHGVDCGLYAADAAAAAADHERRRGIRPPTDTERTLIDALEYEQPAAGEESFIRFDHGGGVHWRVPVIGPDADPEGFFDDRYRPAERPGDTPGE